MPETTPTLTDEQRAQLDATLRKCRVEDGSPAPLLDDWDRYHVLSMVAPVVAGMVADAEQRALREAADEVAAWSTRASWVALDAVEASLRDRADRIGTTP